MKPTAKVDSNNEGTDLATQPAEEGDGQSRVMQMDWQQVALNGGSPCFAALDDEKGWYCGRAEHWDGHDGEHEYVSLNDLLTRARVQGVDGAIKIARMYKVEGYGDRKLLPTLEAQHVTAASIAGELRELRAALAAVADKEK